jgi:putative membrane protein
MNLTEQSLKILDQKIQNFEASTKGEIRLALLQSSDPYPGANYRISFILSFALIALIQTFFSMTNEQILILLFSLMICLFYFAQFMPFRPWFILPSEKTREVKEKATEIFYSYGLAHTQNRIGILLFISKLERKIELLVDQAIIDKLGQKTLDQLVRNISQNFKKAEYEKGLLEAFDFLEKELTQAFPHGLQEKNLDEMSNKIILG